MARIRQTFETRYSAQETREFMDKIIFKREEFTMFLAKLTWMGNTLMVESKIANGEVVVRDKSVSIDLELTLLGSPAQKKIEQAFEQGFKMLNEGKKEE